MAVDNWTINLKCDGEAEGRKDVQIKMDRDQICYFNLIDLIKDYGYTALDYLYFKSTDGLVVIEQDPEVMEMLKECESKKMVKLFVTKQRLATLAPRTKSSDEPSKSKPNETKGDCNEVSNKRKGTVLTHVWDLLGGDRIVVKCNMLGQPIGKEGGLLGQFLGTIARNGGYCPVGAKDWREVKKNNAETIIQFIQTKFLYPVSCEKWIFKSIGRDWRKYKATLKKKLFNPKKKRSVLNKRCPDDIDEKEWKALVKYWKSNEAKTRSEMNKISCEMKKTTHTAGTKSYARWSEDMRQADPEKKQPHRSKVYLATHRKRGEGINEPVVQLENLLDTQPELAQISEGGVAWKGDALNQVLGEEKAGQVHGMGLLPVPKQVYGQTHHFKDINVLSLDGSSPDVQTHMLEEIRQLKERSEMQDKVIEELKNNQRHHVNQEATMGNYARGDHNSFENQVVQSKRKRVHGVAPNQNDGFLKHREELNKEIIWESEFNDDDNLLLSTPSTTTKKQKGGPRETTTIAHQEMAHDKVACYQHLSHKQLKVGSMVLLMTSKYPNKAHVAYATLLSTDPETIVGGVKTGTQFYKVRINHPIAKDEPLVRPMPGCNNIGDAQAKGVPIAWPSMFVEMING